MAFIFNIVVGKKLINVHSSSVDDVFLRRNFGMGMKWEHLRLTSQGLGDNQPAQCLQPRQSLYLSQGEKAGFVYFKAISLRLLIRRP